MNKSRLTATDKEQLDPGFRRVYAPPKEEPIPPSPPAQLTRLKKGQRVYPKAVRMFRNPPAPPPAMHEAALIKALQIQQIGRPATYALIIETLIARRYVTRDDQGKLHTTLRGQEVCAYLVEHFPTLCAYEFTANMETALDQIAHGRRTYLEVVGKLWETLQHETPNRDLKEQTQ